MSHSSHNGLAAVLARFQCLRVRRWVRLIGLLMLVGMSLVVAACGKAQTPPAAETTATSGTAPATLGADEVPVLSPEETLRQDAQQYAADMGVDLDEAMRRLQYQDDIGKLRAALAANERDTFAGLWVQHQPDFRVIVQFTRGGKKTIRPYIKDKPWADLVEVRKASVTLAELESALYETTRALDRLEFDVSFGLNEKENRVEVWVTDRVWFEAVLREANIQLPEHVELVVVEGHSAKEIDICATPSVPGVAFPRQGPVEGIRVVMEAELIGELVLVNGCLRVKSIYDDRSILPVWPPEFTLKAEKRATVAAQDEIQVLDGAGQVVARVGEEVYMGGGEGSATSLADCVRQQLPADCTGPYWIVGEGVRPNLRHDSDLFALEVISTTGRSFLLLHKKPVLDEWAEGDALLIGKLVLYDYQRCPRVTSDSGLTDYLLLWPPDYGARVKNGEVEIVDGSGQVVARVGEEVRLSGGAIPVDWDSEKYRQLHYELPGDCHGPYWIAALLRHR